ncbi:hypothetical protein AVEN_91215-1, partial [Araneus ventricosus]
MIRPKVEVSKAQLPKAPPGGSCLSTIEVCVLENYAIAISKNALEDQMFS